MSKKTIEPEVTIGSKETRELPVELSESEINERGRVLPVLRSADPAGC